MNLQDALRERGIDLRHCGPGTQRLACPECALGKHRPRDTALALTVEDGERAVWLCHRCGFKGAASAHERQHERDERQRRAEVIRLHEARQRIERERHTSKAEQARAIWRGAAQAAAEHPYLARKRLPPLGLREAGRFQSLARALLVPMRDATGLVANLQGIDPVGEKRFLAGAQTRGAFACIGAWERDSAPELLAIGEGWATVAAFVASRPAYHGVAAMSAANLVAVAQCMREKFPSAHIVILADQDPVGVRAATQAQLAVRGDMMLPGFRFAGVKDFSDLWVQQCV